MFREYQSAAHHPWNIAAVALLSFLGGSLATAHLGRSDILHADGDRVFELRLYHALPGKMPALESRFRDKTSKLLAKHNLNVLGYWVADSGSAYDNTFVWLLAHANREEADRNWKDFNADPAFQDLIKEEQADKLVERVERIYMRPSDFSALK